MFLDILTLAVLLFFLWRIVGALRHLATGPVRHRWTEIVRGLRLRHFVPAPFVLMAVLVVAGFLLEVPGLDFGWWTAIGGLGNPVTGTTERTAGTELEWLIPVVFLTLLIPVLPLFAEREEQVFRLGAEGDSTGRRAWRCVQFGLVHAIVGIPLAFALALSLGGAYFMGWYLRAYRRELAEASADFTPGGATVTAPVVLVGARHAALLESTRAHLAYNWLIVVSVLLFIVSWVVFA